MEEVLPPQTRDGAGFEPPTVRQFTVFLENRVGRLLLLVRQLEADAGSVAALSIEESADSALVRLIPVFPDRAREALHEAGFSFSESEVIVVAFPPGQKPLETLCTALLSAEINIHYMYPMLGHQRGPAMAMYVDDPTLAVRLLIKKQFTLIGESDLGDMKNEE